MKYNKGKLRQSDIKNQLMKILSSVYRNSTQVLAPVNIDQKRKTTQFPEPDQAEKNPDWVSRPTFVFISLSSA